MSEKEIATQVNTDAESNDTASAGPEQINSVTGSSEQANAVPGDLEQASASAGIPEQAERFDVDKMLALAALPEDELNAATAADPSWDALYHFSPLRTNIFAATSFTGEERILEIGARCGALTGYLCDKGKSVDAIEYDPDFFKVLEARCKGRDNLRLFRGTLDEVWDELEDKYDLIVAAGESPELLMRLAGKIGIGGRILFIFSNRFGLKYFAGCRDDGTGELFSGLEGSREDYRDKSYGRGEVEEVAEKAGLVVSYTYYPYPDWKLPGSIFSDERLPEEGELWENERNFDRPRASLFNEQKVFDGLIKNRMFPGLSNSYMLELSYPKDKTFRDEKGRLIPKNTLYTTRVPDERVLYSKASNDRAKLFRIFTDLVRLRPGTREEVVTYRKRAEKGARGHLQEMASAFEQTERSTFGSSVCFNRCSVREDALYLEKVKGESLDAAAWRVIDDEEKLAGIFMSVKDTLGKIYKRLGFVVTDGFSKVFGDIPTYGGGGEEPVDLGIAAKYLDCDLLLSNILVDDGIWNIIDYEWCFAFPVPVNFALYRCVKNFYIIHGIYDESVHENMLLKLGLTKEQLPIFEFMDNSLIRDYVLKDYVNLSDLGQKLLKVSVGLTEIIDAQGKLARKDEIIDELTDTLAKTQKAVSDLQNCASMKVTAPLRAIAAVFKKEERP